MTTDTHPKDSLVLHRFSGIHHGLCSAVGANTSYLPVMCLIALAAILIPLAENAFATPGISKIEEEKCANMYEPYKRLGETTFLEKNKLKSYVYKWLKLYKDPTWFFHGKGKIDSQYEKIASLGLSQSKSQDDSVIIQITSKKLVGKDYYAVKYNLCAKQSLLKPTILAESSLEKFLGVSYLPIRNDSCKTFQINVKAKGTDDVKISYVPTIKDKNFSYLRIVKLENLR